MTFAATFCGNVVDWQEGDTRKSGKTTDYIKGWSKCAVELQHDGGYKVVRLNRKPADWTLTEVREETSHASSF